MTRTTTKTNTMLTFEHPINEQIRLYLRLEALFDKFHRNTHEHSKYAIEALLQIINVVDRPDLKSKLVQTLTLHASNLRFLSKSPDVDGERLNHILEDLEKHIQQLHHHKGKMGEQLRKNEFLSQIRLQLTNPAGACENALPGLLWWLNKSVESRVCDLELWFQPFVDLESTLKLLLSLIRRSTKAQKVSAKKGLFQHSPNPPCELLRISVPADLNIYPEFSANKHRIVIRFLTPDLANGSKPTQTKDNVPFNITYCRI